MCVKSRFEAKISALENTGREQKPLIEHIDNRSVKLIIQYGRQYILCGRPEYGEAEPASAGSA